MLYIYKWPMFESCYLGTNFFFNKISRIMVKSTFLHKMFQNIVKKIQTVVKSLVLLPHYNIIHYFCFALYECEISIFLGHVLKFDYVPISVKVSWHANIDLGHFRYRANPVQIRPFDWVSLFTFFYLFVVDIFYSF